MIEDLPQFNKAGFMGVSTNVYAYKERSFGREFVVVPLHFYETELQWAYETWPDWIIFISEEDAKHVRTEKTRHEEGSHVEKAEALGSESQTGL